MARRLEGSAVEAALDAWLAPFLDMLGRKTRRRWAPVYLHGLLGPDGRLEPPAARGAPRAGRPRPAAALHRRPGLG